MRGGGQRCTYEHVGMTNPYSTTGGTSTPTPYLPQTEPSLLRGSKPEGTLLD